MTTGQSQKRNLCTVLLSCSYLTLMSIFLTACQTTFKTVPTPQEYDLYRILFNSSAFKNAPYVPIEKIANTNNQRQMATLSCSGFSGCEIAAVDNVTIIKEQDKLPHEQALAKAMIRLDQDEYTDGRLKYYVVLPAGMHEIHIRYYPSQTGYYEKFAVFHQFNSQGNYQINAYRQNKPTQDTSLLDLAEPAPICIDILNNKRLERRFCKTSSNQKRQEFRETLLQLTPQLSSQTKVTSKL